MLFDAQQMSELNAYIDQANDKDLLRWWAQYAESNARFREALQYYEKAKDHLAIVRVLCFHKKFERAAANRRRPSEFEARTSMASRRAKTDRIVDVHCRFLFCQAQGAVGR